PASRRPGGHPVPSPHLERKAPVLPERELAQRSAGIPADRSLGKNQFSGRSCGSSLGRKAWRRQLPLWGCWNLFRWPVQEIGVIPEIQGPVAAKAPIIEGHESNERMDLELRPRDFPIRRRWHKLIFAELRISPDQVFG